MPSSPDARRAKWRIDDDDPAFLKRNRHRQRLRPADAGSEAFGLPEGDKPVGQAFVSPRPSRRLQFMSHRSEVPRIQKRAFGFAR